MFSIAAATPAPPRYEAARSASLCCASVRSIWRSRIGVQFRPVVLKETPMAVALRRVRAGSSSSDAIGGGVLGAAGKSPGLYSAGTYDLTVENVDLVLEDVRPYLIADGGNVDVVSVEDGVVYLQLQGACGTCPSSTTTMKMGIERVLKEKFGDSIKEICQIFDDVPSDTTVEAINSHLEILRPAISNYGGSVEVISVEGENCHVKYTGPESIGSGIRAAIKEKFPNILNVIMFE